MAHGSARDEPTHAPGLVALPPMRRVVCVLLQRHGLQVVAVLASGGGGLLVHSSFDVGGEKVAFVDR